MAVLSKFQKIDTLLSEDIIKTSDYKDEKTDDKIEIEKIRVSKKLYYS